MTRKQLLIRLLLKAAWVRKDRALTALLSVAVVATIATAALTVYYDLENKLSREFRSFGANVVITSPNGLTTQQFTTIRTDLGKRGTVVPVGYAIARAANDTKVVIGGADLSALRQLNSWWSIQQADKVSTGALVGRRASDSLSPHGEKFLLRFEGRSIEVQPQVVFTSGSDDDSRVYLDTHAFQALTAKLADTALVRIDGSPREIQARVDQLSAALPDADVKPIRQITHTQTAVIGKTRSVVLIASAVVVVLIMLCMAATFTSSVLERRRDFAVMKALGASDRTVNVLFASESSLLAIAGAAIGYLAGSGVAFWIGKANFDAAIMPQPLLLGPVVVGSILLALVASTAPLRTLQQIQPAGILRGE